MQFKDLPLPVGEIAKRLKIYQADARKHLRAAGIAPAQSFVSGPRTYTLWGQDAVDAILAERKAIDERKRAKLVLKAAKAITTATTGQAAPAPAPVIAQDTVDALVAQVIRISQRSADQTAAITQMASNLDCLNDKLAAMNEQLAELTELMTRPTLAAEVPAFDDQPEGGH